ncbi:uncharacterized protein [Primulina huaijiensis]|uniref:uncharacterized protein n=1 Tax=Primulina huaijiensis TaxID=1492673 RepID=UPI003CC7497B
MWRTFRCFICKEEGHKAADCPRNKGPTTGRAYIMHTEEAEAEPDSTLITGRIFISGVASYALLDSGFTHSFISETFVKRLEIIREAMDLGFRVSISSGNQMFKSRIVRNLEIRFQKNAVQADLIVLLMPEFDIILVSEPVSQRLEDVKVVRDFPSVFQEDISGIPPDREVDFSIELMPSTVLISKTPYRLEHA